MRNKQTGVSLSGLIIVFVILIFIALLGFKVGPPVAEFYTAKNHIKAIANDKRGASVAEIRKAWDQRTMIDSVSVITAQDLEITKDGSDVVISFAYKKEVPLFANVGLYIDFAANSKSDRGARPVARIPPLDKRIAYQFKSAELREQALTHRSYGSPHNERLEFLGDGVLNCVVAEELYNRFPTLSEGQMSRLRANLVRKESLSGIAQALGLSEFLRLGEGELANGGGSRPSMLADALEAVYGAMLIDGGYAAVRESIRHTFEGEFARLDPAKPAKDAKTLLQEHLQAHQRRLPAYRVVATKGAAHSQTFEVECVVEELKLAATGSGSTRRIAEQNAAGKILKQIG